MKLGKRLVAFAITIILLVTSISRIDVCAAENSLDINSEIVFEGYGQDEIEIPNIQVPDIIYNAEGNEKCNNTFQIDRTQTLSISEDDENTDPDNAVEILNGIPKVNNLATDVIRWYFFEIEELSKVTMFLEMDETIDADLYLFSLDVNSGELTNIAVSLNEGTGIIEAIGRKLETGFYFIAVSGFEGEGNFSLGLYTSTKHIENEFNDSTTTATEVSGVFDINGLHGVIDSPYDYDFYKITLSEASAVRFELKYTSDKYAIYYHSGNAMYAITDDLYARDAGTHYFVVLRTDGGFSSTDTYCLYITNIAPISTDSTARLYSVCDRANIVFQFDQNRTKYYVNGNRIDFSYSYQKRTSSENYSIVLRETEDFNVCLLQTEGDAAPSEWQQRIPEVVHILDSSFTGIKDKYVLQLSVFDTGSAPCYQIHVRGSGSSSDMTLWRDLNWANILIDPDTGKVIDIEWFNYFYEHLSYRFLCSRPYTMKYYYPYGNGREPEGGDA